MPADWEWDREAALREYGVKVRAVDLARDAASIIALDRAYAPHARLAQLRFMRATLQATIMVAERAEQIVGYGARQGGSIGPALGAEPYDTLMLVEALMADMRAAGQAINGMWLPGGNTVLFDWLRRALERSVLTAPAYVF
jgi:hypothetical protein